MAAINGGQRRSTMVTVVHHRRTTVQRWLTADQRLGQVSTWYAMSACRSHVSPRGSATSADWVPLVHVAATSAVIESEQRHQGHMITGVDLEVTTITERISVLERDNTRLRGMLDVESQRVDRLQRGISRVQRELRSMPTATHSRMTQDAINELIAKRVDETLKVYDAARNPELEMRMEDDQQDDHVEENVNNNNGNENGNGNPNVNNGGVVPVARECTYQDFVKCQPLNFKGTEGVVGLTRLFEKMECVFHISLCPPRYQLKYASCNLLDGALTW
ncbi:hypothetical protein Tco_1055402 [Tanacetum coccineum]|uniref:Uncharacterized protein n=1 Tax=Tanacetum coccineum TaxID=301880 RepID=A0ABQ5H0Z9_9ASTR